jgi:L-glutamine-phosphate cytidylyltransferase
MKAVILAAGRGSRLGDMSEESPKCRVDLAGVPMIERQIAAYQDAGITDITLVTGYKAEMLRFDGVKNAHNPDWASTNMVATLFCAEQNFGDDVIVSYGDIVFENRVLKAMIDAVGDVSVIVDRQWRPYWEARFEDPLDDAESLRLDGNGNITEIGGIAGQIDEIQGQYIGLMRFKGAGVDLLREIGTSLDRIERGWMTRRPVTKAYMTDLLMEMILRGHPLSAVPVDGGWLEIDTPDDYDLAVELFAGRRVFSWLEPRNIAGGLT